MSHTSKVPARRTGKPGSDPEGLGDTPIVPPYFHHEAQLWQAWPQPDPLGDILSNAPSRAPGFDLPTADVVRSEELQTKLRLLFARIARLEPEALKEAEKAVSKLERKYASRSKAQDGMSAGDDLKAAPELFNKRAVKKEAIDKFIERVYGPWLDGYRFTFARLRRLDPSAAAAVARYKLDYDDWPAHIPLPTVKEVNDRLIKDGRIEALQRKRKEEGFLPLDEGLELRRLTVARSSRRPREPN